MLTILTLLALAGWEAFRWRRRRFALVRRRLRASRGRSRQRAWDGAFGRLRQPRRQNRRLPRED